MNNIKVGEEFYLLKKDDDNDLYEEKVYIEAIIGQFIVVTNNCSGVHEVICFNDIGKILNKEKQIVYTTIPECENKVIAMEYAIKQLKKASEIQFPITYDEKQFDHHSVNEIQGTIKILENELNKLKDELERYKKIMGYKEE